MPANFVDCQSCKRKKSARNTGNKVGDFWIYYCPICGHRFFVPIIEKKSSVFLFLIFLMFFVSPTMAFDCDYYLELKDCVVCLQNEPYLRIPELAAQAETRKQKLAFLLAEQGNELFAYVKKTQNERVWYVGEIETKSLESDFISRGRIFLILKDRREIECIDMIANYHFDINSNPNSRMVFLYPQTNRFTFKDISFDNRGKELCIFHISFPKGFNKEDVLGFDIRLEDRAER